MLLAALTILFTLAAPTSLGLPDLFEYSQTLVTRAVNTSEPIQDGQVLESTILWGATATFAYIPQNSTLMDVHVTLNTCTQPLPLNQTSGAWDYAPNLRVYVGNTSLPGPRNSSQTAVLSYGFANLTVSAPGPLYISVQAPARNASWSSDGFAFQIGLSTLTPLHNALLGDTHRFLFIQDADFSAALLTTGNLTSNAIPNYQIWVNPSRDAVANNFDASIQESLQASYCGIIRAKAQVTLANADRSMTTRGGNQPKEQFYVHDLQPSTFYDAYITLRNNLTEGGTIWPVQQFRTRDDTTCQIIYNLAFCNEIAYSVPSNTTLYNPVALGTYYDNRALGYFKNFSNTMQQYACNVSDDAKYSLVSTCGDCKTAYKDWLCAVTIPRCADTTNPASFLTLRNQSRSPLLDRDLQPGVYKEVLPCGDLPKNVARTCPAFLQFWLPSNKTVFDAAYGQRSNNATISCNAPGVDFWVAGASVQRVNIYSMLLATVAAIALSYPN